MTVAELLAFRGVGRVFASHINAPEPDKGHPTSAAKLVFFGRGDAERFHAVYAATGFPVRGHVGRVIWNRIRAGAHVGPSYLSRVLLVSGPPAVVEAEALLAFFRRKFDFTLEAVKVWADGRGAAAASGAATGTALVEFRFGSYRCQAESAKMALAREMGALGVRCRFGADPCAQPLEGAGRDEAVEPQGGEGAVMEGMGEYLLGMSLENGDEGAVEADEGGGHEGAEESDQEEEGGHSPSGGASVGQMPM